MIHVGWEKAIAGAMDVAMARRSYPGLDPGSVAGSMTLGMHCLHTSISALCSLSKAGLLQLGEGVTLPEREEVNKGGQGTG